MRVAAAVVLACVLSVCPSVRLFAQDSPQAPTSDVIDRIVAVVGDRAILLSEVDEAINLARQGQELPSDSASVYGLRRQMLDNMIDEELLYQQARADTAISVTDAEIQGAVDQQYRQIRGQFRSEAEFRNALRSLFGSPEEYRRWLTEQSRRQAFTQRYIQRLKQEGKLRSGSVSETEMRGFYDAAAQGGQLPQMPPTITFRQIVIAPVPSEQARRTAVFKAESLRLAIEAGADFSETARRFSDDTESGANGGDLGFFRRGMMVRQFEEVAFNIRPGVVSPVVRTEYGYHIILVDRVNMGEVKARHILVAPAITGVEATVARARADSVAAALRAGASFDSLVRIYGDSSTQRVIPPTNRDSLRGPYREALATGETNDVVGPTPMTPGAPQNTRWLVAQIIDAKPARAATFEDLRDRIRLQLIEQKGMRNLLEDLKRRTYVSIRL